ncbi:MAG: SNF2-related protein [Erysipelotrichaceae bacterium]|nr:SNF2-related protein [Erysipelotrichaceae bacterium]
MNMNKYINDPLNDQLALFFYENNDILEINQKEDEIQATVQAFGYQYHCSLKQKNNELIDYQCDCHQCNRLSPCGHIGAVLMALEDNVILPYHNQKVEKMINYKQAEEKRKRDAYLIQKSKITTDFIDKQKYLYQQNISTILQQTQYELEPVFNDMSVSYRIGNEKKYVIRNISTFLNQIKNKEKVKYGKALCFIHDESAFDEFALKQIEFLKMVNNYLKDNSYSKYYYTSLAKSIELDEGIIDEFFDLYYGYDYPTFQLNIYQQRIRINMVEEENYYILSLDHLDSYIYGQKYLYLYDDKKTLSRIESDHYGVLKNLIQILVEGDFPILKDQYPRFSKYVLSNIEDYIDMDLPINMILNDYHMINLYGDIDDNEKITLRVDYLNDNGSIRSGFDKDFVTNYQQDLVETYIGDYGTIDYDNHIAYLDENNERTYLFLNEGLEFLKNYADIYVSQDLRKLGDKAYYSIQVGVKVESQLLSLDIESDQIPVDEMGHILDQYRRKKKFYRLKNGQLLYLNSPQLEELNELMEDYHMSPKDLDDGHLTMNAYRAFSLNEDSEKYQYIEMNRQQSFKDLIDKFDHINVKEHSLPDYYNEILRDYQKDGIAWMHTLRDCGFNGILADDMGLGKTLQVIALLESIDSPLPSIVICPSSLIYNWESEVYKFSHKLKVGCVVKGVDYRKEIIDAYQEYDLLVTSYDYMRRDFELYEDKTFEYVILDEAQYIKNQKTLNARSVKKLKSNCRLALTGTPIENSLAELWSIFDFLMPQYLFNYHYFVGRFENDIVKNHDKEKTKQLKKLVSPFILRRNKKDVLTELPDKIEKVQRISFNDEEYKIYLANLAQVNTDLQTILNQEKVDNIAILSMLTKLRQLCCEPRLVYENIHTPSSKLMACMEIIENFRDNNQKILLFSSFTSMLNLIGEQLNLKGISYYMLTGQTAKEKRKELVEKFQSDSTTVFLISLKAGGTGLNLTSAQAVIHYDPWWNVSAQNQATDRAYRIGQTNMVQEIKLVMKDSVEEKILDLQEKKKELADIFVENNEGGIASMSKDEIRSLFEIN